MLASLPRASACRAAQGFAKAVCDAPHLSSLVLRDRLRMHMQAAARMGGLGSDSAVAICRAGDTKG